MTLAPDRFNAIESLGGGAAPPDEPSVEYPIWLGGETGQTMLFEVDEDAPKDPLNLEPADNELSFGVVAVFEARVVGRPTDDEPDILVDRVNVYRENEARPIFVVSPDGSLDANTKPNPFTSLFMAATATYRAMLYRWDDRHADLSGLAGGSGYPDDGESSEHADWKVKPED